MCSRTQPQSFAGRCFLTVLISFVPGLSLSLLFIFWRLWITVMMLKWVTRGLNFEKLMCLASFGINEQVSAAVLNALCSLSQVYFLVIGGIITIIWRSAVEDVGILFFLSLQDTDLTKHSPEQLDLIRPAFTKGSDQMGSSLLPVWITLWFCDLPNSLS